MKFSCQPQIEFVWLRKINFRPEKPTSFEHIRSITIGSKSRNLGDTLAITTLPRKLMEKFPHLKVFTYPRAFNPVVFHGNPHVTGIRYLPPQVFGDDCISGTGHVIHLKERFFDFSLSRPTKPEIYLLPSEKRWADDFLALHTSQSDQPLCVIHPFGTTFKSVLDLQFWNKLVKDNSGKCRFLQVGLKGHPFVEGCAAYLHMGKCVRNARKLFALLSNADLFIGVNSGPMHVSRAFDVPSLILTEDEDAEEIFKKRIDPVHSPTREELFNSFLYEENEHIECRKTASNDIFLKVGSFIDDKIQD